MRISENWHVLESIEVLDKVEKESYNLPVVLFKHSVRCGISAYAEERLKNLHVDDSFQFYYLDLINYREVSNEIAKRFGVIHQSPQILVIKDGKATFTTSHHMISPEIITKNLN